MIVELATEGLRAIIGLLKVNRRAAKIVLGTGLFLLAVGATLRWFPPSQWKQWDNLTSVSITSLIAGAFFAFVGGAALSPVEILGGIDLELGSIRQERDEIQERIESAPQPDVKDSILLNLNQLTEYYTINKAQARSSFRASLFAIIVGLLTIVGGIWIFYLGSSPSLQLTAISTIGGVLIEFIGGAYFILYNKTSAQSNYLYDRLVRTQDTMLAVSLCSGIEDSSLRNDTTRQIVMALLNRGAPGAGGYATNIVAAGNNSPSVPSASPARSTRSRAQPSRVRRASGGDDSIREADEQASR